jgi:hypothetical protein
MQSENKAPEWLLFFLTLSILSKPTEKFGQYDWLIKPDLYLDIAGIFYGISIFSVVINLILTLKYILISRGGLVLTEDGLKRIFVGVLFILASNIVNLYEDVFFGLKRVVGLLGLMLILFIYHEAKKIKLMSCDRGSDSINQIKPIFEAIWLYSLLTILIYFIDSTSVSSPAIYGSRLYGISDHPNFLGAIVAIGFGIYFLANERISNSNENSKNLIIRGFVYCVLAFLIFKTGSRTALIMVAGILLYSAPRNIFIYSFIIGVLVFVFGGMFDAGEILDSRIFTIEDNRSLAWINMLKIFYDNPVIGVGLQTVGLSENSFLLILASSGVVGFLGVVILILSAFNGLDKSIKPLFIGLILGGIFEGFWMDAFTIPILIILYILFGGMRVGRRLT